MSRWCDHELKPGKGKMWAGMWECIRCGRWVKRLPETPQTHNREGLNGVADIFAVEAMDQAIPAEAVEVAARVMWSISRIDPWEEAPDYLAAEFRNDARVTLEAAAPHVMAAAWDEGMEAMYGSTSSEWPPIPEANPYRKSPHA